MLYGVSEETFFFAVRLSLSALLCKTEFVVEYMEKGSLLGPVEKLIIVMCHLFAGFSVYSRNGRGHRD